MDDLVLAEGERIVRSYDCTTVDHCAVVMGTAIPLGSKRKRESHGTVTVTDKRVIYDLRVSGKGGGSMVRQEVSISGVSSISSMFGRFGRDARLPMILVALGFLMMFAPYVYAVETGMLSTGGDYELGYNFGVEYGYYEEYTSGITSGVVENTIPVGYVPPEIDEFGSPEYVRGMAAGEAAGKARALQDISSDRGFGVPTDLMIHNSAAALILVSAIAGAVVFVLGSVLHVLSYRSADWIHLKMGSGWGSDIFITNMSGGEDRCGTGPQTAGPGYRMMAEEIGAVIAEQRVSQMAGGGRT